jgi:hypothetical protein
VFLRAELMENILCCKPVGVPEGGVDGNSFVV